MLLKAWAIHFTASHCSVISLIKFNQCSVLIPLNINLMLRAEFRGHETQTSCEGGPLSE